MKRFNNINTIIGLFTLLLLGACNKDYLERTPSDFIKEDEVFTNIENAEKFLNNAYTALPNFFKPGADANWTLASGSDETEQIWDNGVDANFFNTGGWNPSVFPLSQLWSDYYRAVRRINIFLKNYEKIPDDKFDLNRKKRMKGEAHALRAYYYFELYKMWGGVPIIETALDASDAEGVLLPRNTEDEVQAFIKKNLDDAIPLLPARNVTSQFGRMTATACKFLLARTQLYHASALHNPANDASRWQAAATTIKAALDDALANGYQLCTTPLNSKKPYERMFLEPDNTEAIFTRVGNTTIGEWNSRYMDQVTQSNGYGGWCGTCPTQEMVDAYEMATGLAITDPGSGYNPQNPYVNRDPRFYQSILCHGQIWKGRAIDVRTGGIDVIGNHPPTNYFMRKFMIEEINLNNGANRTYRPWILMRVGELHLMYAEAQNEAVGPDATVYSAVNTIRSRAGMPALPAGLSKDQMRQRIRQERRVELAFEEHRFWDVRRWKIAEQTDNTPIHYVTITTGGVYSYPIREPRTFIAPKHYLFPIPQSEVDKNPKMKQNPGW